MLQDMVHPPERERLQIDEISSPLSAQIFDFCESELFQETLQNSEVASSSNCCYEENSSYTTNLPFTSDVNKFTSTIDNNSNTKIPPTTANSTGTTTTTTPTAAITNNNSNLSIIFDSSDEIENDISASIDFTPSPTFSVPHFLNPQHEQFDLSLLQTQIPLSNHAADGALSQYPTDPVVPFMGPPLPPLHEEDCLSSMPSYMRLIPSSPPCSFLDPTINSYLPGNLNAALSAENSGIFTGNLFLGSELQPQELDFQGDNGGIFCPESLPRVYNSSELQALSNESQHLVNGGGNSTPLVSEVTSLEDSTFKVGKLSVEQRKEKIHRYMKKRNERNFSKKIKYACRKTLADSRPRVRGRFAKNDEFGEITKTTYSTHEEDTDEDVRSIHVVVKEEEEMVDSLDIFAHISGVNSFKCNYPIQSWI